MADNPSRHLGRNTEFRRYFMGIFPVEFGFQMASVTLGWQVCDLARQTRSIGQSAFLVGMIGLAQFVPLVFLTLYAGTLADQISRKCIVLAALVIVALASAALTMVAAVSTLFISGSNELGEFESGGVSRCVGPVVAAVAGGIGTLIVTGLWAFWFPDLRKADRMEAVATVPPNPEA